MQYENWWATLKQNIYSDGRDTSEPKSLSFPNVFSPSFVCCEWDDDIDSIVSQELYVWTSWLAGCLVSLYYIRLWHAFAICSLLNNIVYRGWFADISDPGAPNTHVARNWRPINVLL